MKKAIAIVLFGLLFGLGATIASAQGDSVTIEEPSDTIFVEESVPVYYEENTEEAPTDRTNYVAIAGIILVATAALILIRRKKK